MAQIQRKVENTWLQVVIMRRITVHSLIYWGQRNQRDASCRRFSWVAREDRSMSGRCFGKDGRAGFLSDSGENTFNGGRRTKDESHDEEAEPLWMNILAMWHVVGGNEAADEPEGDIVACSRQPAHHWNNWPFIRAGLESVCMSWDSYGDSFYFNFICVHWRPEKWQEWIQGHRSTLRVLVLTEPCRHSEQGCGSARSSEPRVPERAGTGGGGVCFPGLGWDEQGLEYLYSITVQ